MDVCIYEYEDGKRKYQATCKEANGRKFKPHEVARIQKLHTKKIIHQVFGEIEVSICPYCKKELVTAR